MGIFDRFSTLLRSNINDLISRAEDPEKMLNQILVDMKSQLVKAKLAVREGRDDLAKQALVRHGEHASHGQQLQQTWESHRVETEKLKDSLRGLNDKIEEAKRKKNLLLARQRRAQAQKRIAETMWSMSENPAFAAFTRM